MGIRSKLTIILAAIGIGTSATAIGISLGISINAVEQLNKNAIAALSRSFKNTYDDFMASNTQLLVNFARNPDFIQAVGDNAVLSLLIKKAAEEELERLTIDNPQIVEIYIARGETILLSPATMRPYFSAQKIKPGAGTEGNGSVRVAVELADPQTNRPSGVPDPESSAKAPRAHENSDNQLYLVAYVDLGALIHHRIREMKLTPDTNFLVYDSNNHVLVMHTDEATIRLARGRVSAPDVARMLQTQSGFVEYSLGDSAKIGYLVREDDLAFVASMPRDEVYETVTTVTRLSLLLALVEILVAFVLGYSVSRSFTQPLLSLTDAAKAFRKHQYATRIYVKGRDELAVLARTFNEMGAEIEGHTSNLEILVKERTRELEEKIAQIERLSITDTLTGIYNRAYFEKTLDQEIVRAKRNGQVFGVVFFDLDHFKDVNDKFGHIAGDRVLVNLAGLVGARIRESDTFARWGGEEFAIILPHTDAEGTKNLAENLRVAVMDNEIAGVGKRTSSFGCTMWVENDDIQSIMSRVDKGLYRAKQDGRNLVRFV